MLRLKQIHMTFSSSFTGYSGKKETEQAEVLKGVDIDFAKGKVTALLGTNGSGKSTLFNIISGLLRPTSGNVIYTGGDVPYDLTKIPAYLHARIGIARLFQGSNIFPDLTVMENMKLADNNFQGEQPWHVFHKVKSSELRREQEAEYILTKLLGAQNPLWEMRYQLAGTLSVGQQRLLAFARLFMNRAASLFLLDEPCAGVNPQIRERMAQMIRELGISGKTVVLIEHDLDFVTQTCYEACYIEDGRVKFKGGVVDILHQTDLMVNFKGQINKN
jgi:ABC-type branched-subunit amino acid transport system ATPase component